MFGRRTLSVVAVMVPGEVINVGDIKDILGEQLRGHRASMLAKIDGLSEYDRRRPMTPTGTNLLGLVKHLAGEEYGYLGEVFDRPPTSRPTWFREDPATEIDMWATPEESSGYIIDVYRLAAAHADETVRSLSLNSPGLVRHWGSKQTTLGSMLVGMISETARHAGHADIVRELIDGTVSPPNIPERNDQCREVQAAADRFR